MKTNNKKVEDKFYGKRVVKGIFTKARFESRNDYIDTILNLSTLLSNAESLIANKKIDAAKKVLKQAQAIVDSNPNHKELDSQGMVQGLNKLKRKVGMSRTGSKAKFADDGRAKALVILQQLGGNMFVAMTGAKNLSTESNPPALSMKVGSGAQNKVKHLKVVLDEGSDTYTMIFFDSKGSTIKKLDHVYAEDLRRIFTEVTGFYTSLTRHSRTGAKAKFATVKSQGHTFRIDHFDGDEYKLYMLLDGEFKFIKKTEQPQRWIEANVRSGDPSKWLPSAMARTGAKAKFGDPVYGKDPVSSASNKVVLKLKGGITATLIRQNGEWSVIEFPNAKTFRNLQVMYQYLSGKANSDKLSELK